jgi:hypothetical protein
MKGPSWSPRHRRPEREEREQRMSFQRLQLSLVGCWRGHAHLLLCGREAEPLYCKYSGRMLVPSAVVMSDRNMTCKWRRQRLMESHFSCHCFLPFFDVGRASI